MKMQISRMIMFAGLTFIVSCREPKNTELSAEKEDTLQVFVKPPSGSVDTLRISRRTAVFFQADSGQLKKIKSVISANLFESMLHDCFYQMRNARTVLKQNMGEIAIVETSTARWLLFEQSAERKRLIDLDKNNELCGIYLFNVEEDPLFIDMMNIDTQAGFYFGKKK